MDTTTSAATKRLIIGAVAVVAAIGLWQALPKKNPTVSKIVGLVQEQPIKICVNTWGGFAGGQWYNGGFKATKDSHFYQEEGILVEFIKMDENSRPAWQAGECDLLWGTVDAFVTEVGGLTEYKPKVPFQVDWSRGGDVIVATRDIQSVNDLRGKQIAVALGTPSHSLLLWALKNAGMSTADIEIVKVATEPNAVSTFKANQVAAAVVWSPDDADCIEAVPGSHVLISTKQATDIVADAFLVKEAYLKENHEKLVKLYEGWMKGNAEVNTNPQAFEQAVQITSEGYGMPADFMAQAIKNTRLVTHSDNKNFFGLNPTFKGMKGDELYTKTGALYQSVGYIESFPSWRTVVDTSIVASAKGLDSPNQVAEATKEFTKPTLAVQNAKALTTKPVTVNFAVNSSTLDGPNRTVLDQSVSDTLKQFKESYIRIEGNTDTTGNPARNADLSKERADSVGRYLSNTYGFSKDRFVVVGNGSSKPACDESNPGPIGLEACKAKNRRTDFEVLK